MGPRTRGRPEPAMSVARSVAEVLRDHVVLEVEAIDRMYLNVYVPHLQSVGAVVGYLRVHRGQRFASTTAVTPMTEAFVRNIDQFVNDEGVDLVAFKKGQRKDDVTQKYVRKFTQREGVLYVGKAQEKARVMRTERRCSRFTGGTYPWIVESTAMVNHYTPNSLKSRDKSLAFCGWADSDGHMIRGGFLSEEDRHKLIALARDGSAACRVTRRANALVLLDDGWSCRDVAKAFLLDDDTIRGWGKLFEQRGIEGLTSFDMGGSTGFLSAAQEDDLKAWVGASLPRTTRQVGAWIEQHFGLVYESRSGLIALLHRLGLDYHKPNVIPRKLDEEKQKAFIASYEKLLNSLADNEAVLFADAVHPTHAARPVGCWAPKQDKLAIEQTSGRQRINIHGALDLATGQTRMIEVATVDAASTIRLLEAIEALYPMLALIHVFLDNARYHHAKLVQDWLSRPDCRIRLHFVPAYCPHLNPIERLWGVMHKHVTHNKCYATFTQFADAMLSFLREEVPRNWANLRDSVTDNFRVISPNDFRVMA